MLPKGELGSNTMKKVNFYLGLTYPRINVIIADPKAKKKSIKMFEQIKSEIGNTPIRIEYVSGKVRCGVILDYIDEDRNDIGNWKFIPFNNLTKFETTEDPKLIERIEEKNVVSIDMILK